MKTLTPGQYSALVSTWNGRNKTARQELAAECKASGHNWAWVPWLESKMCVRCCAYRIQGRS